MRVSIGRVGASSSRTARWGLAAALAGAALGAGAQAPSCDFCGVGRNQSPVRLEGAVDASAAGPTLAYAAETVEVKNTGQTLYVYYPDTARSGLEFDAPGNRYQLREFHFHAPAEHAFGAAAALGPMEVHFVHRRDGALAVVAVPIAVGPSTHPLLSALFEAIPAPGTPRKIEGFNALALAFHGGVRVLRYPGSLTTGTCDEGVSWFVYDVHAPVLTVSAADLERYRRAFPADYARSPQPLNARQILRVGPPSVAPAP